MPITREINEATITGLEKTTKSSNLKHHFLQIFTDLVLSGDLNLFLGFLMDCATTQLKKPK